MFDENFLDNMYLTSAQSKEKSLSHCGHFQSAVVKSGIGILQCAKAFKRFRFKLKAIWGRQKVIKEIESALESEI